ncbi:hypothetical protein [Sphingobium sp. CR28]|uniref:hypothetical protein n=1 Tax=Sphingobium sp. CR28 TaxID=3400272 RepID=UPI003FF01295
MARWLDALQQLERKRGWLGMAKLANVALAMLWGFVVTFVFVRVLPLADFRAFLLLVAFANFTVSAEFGFSTIIYARLRRHLITREGTFRSEEVGVLLAFMLGVILLGGMLLLLAMRAGLITTGRPALFIAFYGVAAMNLVALLAKRALAALDHNLWWEGLDLIRRVSGIALLLGALAGLSIFTSVIAQLLVAAVCVLIGLATVHRALRLPVGHWFAWRAGGRHVRQHYLADIGRTMLLTVSDIAAYNAPYFTIAAATKDVRPLLVFDFIFKMSRAVSGIIRALVETAMPAITRSLHVHDAARFSASLRRVLKKSVAVAALLALLIVAAGDPLSSVLFDRQAVLGSVELAIVALLLLGLAPICVSVYVQTGLARFAPLLTPSFALLAGSLLSVPSALLLSSTFGWPFTLAFAAFYAGVHLVLGFVHFHLVVRITP